MIKKATNVTADIGVEGKVSVRSSGQGSPMVSEIAAIKRFCGVLKATGQPFFLTDQVRDHLDQFLAGDDGIDERTGRAVRRRLRGCPEMLLDGDTTYAVLRPGVGHKRIVRVHPQLDHLETISRDDYLEVKDSYIQGYEAASRSGLVIDFAPFFRNFPKINEASEMGAGISFLNRHLSGQMYSNPKVFSGALLDFFKNCSIGGMTILANDHLATADVLLEELNYVRSLLDDHTPDEPYVSLAHELRVHGFEAGWGCDARSIGDNLTRLAQVLESPDPDRMEALFARLPLIRTVLMVSPHGWFAQEGVLGKPDTGGQVTYVLDQARALENVMRQRFTNSGLDIHPRVVILTRLIPDAEGTTCNVPREKIMGTEDSWIIRAPFHDESGELINQWISRFHIWPHLERFTQESQHLVVTECLGRPDLIIGHYTDGNLVAHRLADELGVTHCACVHALEKTKYLLSDMHWGGMEHDYRFSMQFTADLIAYNAADFILASSYREVGGTSAEMGMIESYEMFSMPGLYRVRSGFDPRLARHNIVPPGASEEYFFPYHEHNQRVEPVAAELRKRLLGEEPGPSDVGRLAYPERPPVFAMARMDRIKNLPGLVEMFGTSESLRERANLLLISSITNASLSQDQEEIEQIHRTYELIDRYQLDGHIRWCAARLDKSETGEIYRVVADMGGLFAQPAFMETFGLTVVEAMACGLPVVVTCFGGPSEIVVHGLSGLVVNPNDQEAYADAMESVIRDSDRWHGFSEEGIRRVQEAFTWPRHATSVLRLANVYSYWNYLDVMNRQALDQYIHTLYHTVYRPRTQAMLQAE